MNSQLKQHVSAAHDRLFKCVLDCQMVFDNQNNLDRHISNVHEGNKPFKCSICNKKFGRKDVLKDHISAVHEGIKRHQCTICEKAFSRKDKLARHMLQVHEEK